MRGGVCDDAMVATLNLQYLQVCQVVKIDEPLGHDLAWTFELARRKSHERSDRFPNTPASAVDLLMME